MHLGSVPEGDATLFTQPKIKAMVSAKVAFITSLVLTTKYPLLLLIPVNNQVRVCDRQASESVCCVMSTPWHAPLPPCGKLLGPTKQVEWCMMYCRVYDNSQTGQNIQLILSINNSTVSRQNLQYLCSNT